MAQARNIESITVAFPDMGHHPTLYDTKSPPFSLSLCPVLRNIQVIVLCMYNVAKPLMTLKNCMTFKLLFLQDGKHQCRFARGLCSDLKRRIGFYLSDYKDGKSCNELVSATTPPKLTGAYL